MANLVQEVSKQIKSLASQSKKNKDSFKHARVSDVKEYEFQKDGKKTKALVVFLPYSYYSEHKSQVKVITNYLTEQRKMHTFVIAKRTVINKKSDYKQQIPQSRTLTAVNDAILEDLIIPGDIIGRRTRVRLDGSQLIKVFLSDKHEKFLTDKVELICNLYKALTNRKLAIEFRPEVSYICIPKRRENKRRHNRKRNRN